MLVGTTVEPSAILGTAGDDVISMGQGDHIVTGLSGSDTFVFSSDFNGGSTATVTDFDVNADLIQIHGTAFADLVITDSEGSARISWDNGTALLQGVDPLNVSSDMFEFI